MKFNVRCWTPPHGALATAMILLSGCAGVGFDTAPGACPPVVEYTRTEQLRVAEELAALPKGALISEWLADYAVLSDQARVWRTVRDLDDPGTFRCLGGIKAGAELGVRVSDNCGREIIRT